MIVLNFSDRDVAVWLPFLTPGKWIEQIDAKLDPIDVPHDDHRAAILSAIACSAAMDGCRFESLLAEALQALKRE